MSQSTRIRERAVAVSCLLIVVVGTLSAGVAGAQQGLGVTIDAPEEPTAGEETTLSASVSAPDLRLNYEGEFIITFYSDGRQIGSKTVTVATGETASVELSHTFENAGNKQLRIEATTTLGGQEYSGSKTTTVTVAESEPQVSIDGDVSTDLDVPDSPEVGQETTVRTQVGVPSVTGVQRSELRLRLLVDGEETAVKTITVDGMETTETDFTTVFDSAGETTVTLEAVLTAGDQTVNKSVSKTVAVSETQPPTTTVEGAAFTVPESLEDEVAAYREGIPRELEANASVIATEEQLYVVFSRAEPTEGVATAEGVVLERNLTSENLTFGVIAATNVSFDTTGTEVGVQDVADDPDRYQLDLVRVDSHYRRVATLTDPDSESDVTVATTTGILVDDPRTAGSLFDNLGNNTRALSRNASANTVDVVLDDPRQPHLHTVSFETAFWADAEATVDAIVLDPQSAARQFVDEYDRAGVARAEEGAPVLYVVEENFQPQTVESVSAVKSQADSLDGTVVEANVRLYQETISVQETLEHSGSACGENLLEVETSQGPICVNVAQDQLIHGGLAWNTVPQSRTDGLLIVGVSSRHQDTPDEFSEGRYRIKGEVVSTSRIDESLPSGSVFVVYDLERVGEINYEAVATEARNIVEARTDELTTRLRQQIGEDSKSIETGTVTQTVQSATPGRSTSVEFQQSNRRPVSVQQVQLNVSSAVENLRVNVSGVASLPGSVGQPPGEAAGVVNLSTSVDDSVVSNASFQVRVSSAVISGAGNVTVYRYHEAEWNRLETTVVAETETEIVIRVETPGFSYFAVASEDESEQTESDTQTDTATTQTESDTQTDTATTQTESDIQTDTATTQTESNVETEDTPTESGGTASGQSTSEQSDTETRGSTDSTATGGPGFTTLATVGSIVLFLLFVRKQKE